MFSALEVSVSGEEFEEFMSEVERERNGEPLHYPLLVSILKSRAFRRAFRRKMKWRYREPTGRRRLADQYKSAPVPHLDLSSFQSRQIPYAPPSKSKNF